MFANFDKRTLVIVTCVYFLVSLMFFIGYILIDRPNFESEYIPTHVSYMSDPRQNYVEVNLDETQTREWIVSLLEGTVKRASLQNVAFSLSCNNESCLVSFYGTTDETKEKAAEAKRIFINHLYDVY